MSSVTASHDHEENHGPEIPWSLQLRSNRLGMWLFCLSEVFLFGALLVARFALWGTERPALSQQVGLFTTIILLVSSFYVYRGETAMAHGDSKTLARNYTIAAALGFLFFLGVVVLEWNIFGLEAEILGVEIFGHLKLSDNVNSGIFFAMTGWHSLHVISGVFLLLIQARNARRGLFTTEKHWGVEASAIYWHFVDVVWVFFYPALYLMGTTFHG